MAAVHVRKAKLELHRFIYVGSSVLDLMFEFYNSYILNKCQEKIKLFFTETDSLCYEITIPYIYKDMTFDCHYFDTSGYPKYCPLYSARPAQCLLVAHHGYWVPCSSRLNCAGFWSRLKPQKYSVHDPCYALAITIPITCCLAGRCLQAKAGRRELQNQTTLSQLWVNNLTAL